MTRIAVYADWAQLGTARRLGFLHARRGGAGELFEFEYEQAALADPLLALAPIDPRIGLFDGPQYPAQGRDTFGVFSDSSPDRWGRMLMNRRLDRDKRAARVPSHTRLFESDYLLGVHDAFRVGALRFKRDDLGPFLDEREGLAAPPLVQLRQLEAASRALENDHDNTAIEGVEWLRMLIAPGGSLGGARPKASVVDPDGHLWIAKFPSLRDEHNVGAWEYIIGSLAEGCGLRVAAMEAERYASEHHCFRVKRFDRTAQGQRIHFASAMTLTGHTDGEDGSTGVSYLELARVLINQGASTQADLRELWCRIVFNLLVSNTDDHLRNHGFLLEPGRGWHLSPAYDMNPDHYGQGLKLNISEHDNALELELARSVAGYFRVPLNEADRLIEAFKGVVRQWPTLANAMGISRQEQERMSRAFRLAL
ncbi:HipA domain-containing protein [Pseudomonas sp. FH4]|jgi:serine/threonine-protein kinase HipA|uniref:HipA domain-containing protein n=1 Tax=Pseudomonas brenneri TaxID=129817 RepID=A0A5B2UIT9_9PSED|nr:MULTISPECIES: HipA domain-containing protein [Pseudomonas fluorescens group]ETK20336.1 HipA domain-containing protein [Pseudomonas sp. FH4]KAA2226330.1 HipA domain-containing protein [Pseudomonas brenneri]MBF8007470.1 HipA domain-containing protein [Pseudomonas brenneri]TWR72520.1 HipA domain-containing protein [Pseudomonas brenneri]WJM92511.1 HipA domain-containing protein [Pseudomonas brenneri]